MEPARHSPVATGLICALMTDPHLDALLLQVANSSRRLSLTMGFTAVLCVLIAAGIASDATVWTSGWGWRLGGAVGVASFAAAAAALGYGALRRQRRHIGGLRRTLLDDPERIRSIRLLVARAGPYASWSLDDGSATAGLHVFVADDAGRAWVLPVSRSDAAEVIGGLAERCPQASVDP
jgi:hypothetical protein